MDQVSKARIEIRFDVHQPIELVDLTLAFGALAREYRRFLVHKARAEGGKAGDADVRLYITHIENNCIWAELAGATAILGQLFTVIDYGLIFLEFTERVRDGIEFFKKLTSSPNPTKEMIPYSKRDCTNFSDLLNVVAKNKKGALALGIVEYDEATSERAVRARFTFTSEEAHDAQRGALLAQRILDDKGEADYENVLMYFHQTNVEDPKSEGRTGDKAVIRTVTDKPLPVYFVSKLDQERIKSLVDDPSRNPFKASYRVDVNVETDRNDVPRFYRVVRVHEILDEIDDDNTP